MSVVKQALLDALALLMPVDCAGCGEPDRALCEACRQQLVAHTARRSTAGGLSVITALRYELVVRRVILALKEENRTDVASALAPALAAAIERARSHEAGVELVPVPTSREAYQRRGHDPVALLLRKSGISAAKVLRPTRSTASQKTLGAAQRAANLRGAFVASRDLSGRSFVLVDDILTTGATLDEAARAVSEAGGRVLAAATLAFTPRLLAFGDTVRDKPRGEDYGGATGAQ